MLPDSQLFYYKNKQNHNNDSNNILNPHWTPKNDQLFLRLYI